MPSCSAYNCTYRHKKKELTGKTIHRFPFSRPALLKLWMIKVRRKEWYPCKTSFLCSDHFEESCFIRTDVRVLLRRDAVPTLFDFTPRGTKGNRKEKGKTLAPLSTSEAYYKRPVVPNQPSVAQYQMVNRNRKGKTVAYLSTLGANCKRPVVPYQISVTQSEMVNRKRKGKKIPDYLSTSEANDGRPIEPSQIYVEHNYCDSLEELKQKLEKQKKQSLLYKKNIQLKKQCINQLIKKVCLLTELMKHLKSNKLEIESPD